MSMKLELKEVAPYLPYGLKVKYKGQIKELLGLKNHSPWSSQTMVCVNKGEWTYEYEIKPILRPLSDLQNKELDFWIEFELKTNQFDAEYLIEALVNKTFFAKDIHFSFKIYQALFEMHFDVFGLIEKGLAININEINYKNHDNNKSN